MLFVGNFAFFYFFLKSLIWNKESNSIGNVFIKDRYLKTLNYGHKKLLEKVLLLNKFEVDRNQMDCHLTGIEIICRCFLLLLVLVLYLKIHASLSKHPAGSVSSMPGFRFICRSACSFRIRRRRSRGRGGLLWRLRNPVRRRP